MKNNCLQCPRQCGVDRENGAVGYCRAPWNFTVSRASLHMWEEPSVSGTRGSGTLFYDLVGHSSQNYKDALPQCFA